MQVLTRDNGNHLTTGISMLRRETPHLLIATPQALMDVLREDRDAIQLSELSCVVVDEVDYLVDTNPIKESIHAGTQRRAQAKQIKLDRHPGITRDLLDIIYARRKRLDPRNERVDDSQSPQLILSSATLSLHLSDFLFGQSGWLNKNSVMKVLGSRVSEKAPSDVRGKGRPIPSIRGISHSILIVSDAKIKNISFAVPSRTPAAELLSVEARNEFEPETLDPKLTESKFLI